MVNRALDMLISEFAREAGLTVDTVRFYVRRGLLTPEASGKGGRHPYQVFTEDHVRAARFIRTAQSLGLSLKDLEAIGERRRAGRLTPEYSVEVLSVQLDRLVRKSAELQAMASYLRAKIAWIAEGETGSPPSFELQAGRRSRRRSRP